MWLAGDVSKGKAWYPFFVPLERLSQNHLPCVTPAANSKELADCFSLDGETRVVMEHTGRYYEPVAQFLCHEESFVSAVNPEAHQGLWQQFATQGQDRCTDSRKIARYGLDNWNGTAPTYSPHGLRYVTN